MVGNFLRTVEKDEYAGIQDATPIELDATQVSVDCFSMREANHKVFEYSAMPFEASPLCCRVVL